MSRHTHDGNEFTYTVGFVIALGLTYIASLIVTKKLLSGWAAASVLIVLAVLQLIVQLYFFLHLGQGKKSRLNILILLFAGLVVSIVVIGSLWIMNNLNYNMMMDKTETDKEIMEDERIYR